MIKRKLDAFDGLPVSLRVLPHTPGPWEIHQPLEYPYIRSVAPETPGYYVMDHAGGPSGHGYVRMQADADLLLLAPTAPHECEQEGCPGRENKRRLQALEDLIAAVKRYMSGHPCSGGHQCPTWGEAMRALAKAEGKP